MTKVKEYTNGEVTVVWKPEMCIHSEKCWRGLPEVFKPKEKPWVQTDGASTEAIVNQVSQCPSGALSYEMNNEKNKEKMENDSKETKVQVLDKGPLMVTGTCEITHKDGSKETKDKVAFCRCGASSNKPFCDGSHKQVEFDN